MYITSATALDKRSVIKYIFVKKYLEAIIIFRGNCQPVSNTNKFEFEMSGN